MTRRKSRTMRRQTVLRVVSSKLLIPYLLLFAFYVQFHGDFGPGGGFQAGVILAAGFILFALVYGPQALQKVCKPRVVEFLVALGVLIYGGTGVVTLLLGENFLDYDALNPAHPSHGQHYGIFAVELGVGVTVTAVMLSIFYSFAGRGRQGAGVGGKEGGASVTPDDPDLGGRARRRSGSVPKGEV